MILYLNAVPYTLVGNTLVKAARVRPKDGDTKPSRAKGGGTLVFRKEEGKKGRWRREGSASAGASGNLRPKGQIAQQLNLISDDAPAPKVKGKGKGGKSRKGKQWSADTSNLRPKAKAPVEQASQMRMTRWDQNKGKTPQPKEAKPKLTPKAKPKTVALKSENILAVNDRLNAKAIDSALRGVGSDGINERVNQLNQFIHGRNLKVAFTPYTADVATPIPPHTPTDKIRELVRLERDEVIQGSIAAARNQFMSAYSSAERQQVIDDFGYSSVLEVQRAWLLSDEEAVSLSEEDAVALYRFGLGFMDPAEGYTSREYNHVVVRAAEIDGGLFTGGKVIPSGNLGDSSAALREGVSRALSAAQKGEPTFTVADVPPDWDDEIENGYSAAKVADAEMLGTYVHEIGHQILYSAQRKAKAEQGLTSDVDTPELRPPEGVRNVSGYGDLEVSNDEWFAESFTAWMVDANAYRSFDPIGADFIEEILEKAMP